MDEGWRDLEENITMTINKSKSNRNEYSRCRSNRRMLMNNIAVVKVK